jgi:glycosyltransferase involved in cell wall biosynthesis
MSLAADPELPAWPGQGGDSHQRTALILGRALHAPWNEGTRVICRNFGQVAGSVRPVRVVSLTQTRFRNNSSTEASPVPIEHVYSQRGYGINGVYMGLPLVMRRLAASVAAGEVGVAHLFSLPLSLAPWLHSNGARVINHVMVRPLHVRDRVLVRASVRVWGRSVDAFAVTSQTLVPMLSGWGVPASNLFVLPAAVDAEAFRPGDRLAARVHMGLKPERKLVVYLGRLSPRRFPSRVVREALQQAALATPSRQVHFVALTPGQTFDGSANSSRYLAECARIVEEELRDIPGVTVDVVLHDLDDAAKLGWLRAADAVLLPFMSPEAVEPPITLLEAMACGAMIISSPAANRSGLIQPGVTGQVYRSPAELAIMLSKTIDDAGGAQAIRAAARQAVLARHGFAAVAAATTELWQRVEDTRAGARLR